MAVRDRRRLGAGARRHRGAGDQGRAEQGEEPEQERTASHDNDLLEAARTAGASPGPGRRIRASCDSPTERANRHGQPELARTRRFGAPGRGCSRRAWASRCSRGRSARRRRRTWRRRWRRPWSAPSVSRAIWLGGLSSRSTNWRDAEMRAELSSAMPAKPSSPPIATSTPPPTIRLRLSWMSPLEVSVIVFTPFRRPDHDARPRGAGHHTYRVISDVVVEVELSDTDPSGSARPGAA